MASRSRAVSKNKTVAAALGIHEVTMNPIDYAPAVFEKLFEDLYSLQDSELTWLEIATRLLTYCHQYRPSAASWVGHDHALARRTIFEVASNAAAELFDLDRGFFPPQSKPADPLMSKIIPSAFATQIGRASCRERV